jgi:hypothetical protein
METELVALFIVAGHEYVVLERDLVPGIHYPQGGGALEVGTRPVVPVFIRRPAFERTELVLDGEDAFTEAEFHCAGSFF